MNLCSCWFTGRCGDKVFNECCFCCRELVAGIDGKLLKHLEGVVQTLPWYCWCSPELCHQILPFKPGMPVSPPRVNCFWV